MLCLLSIRARRPSARCELNRRRVLGGTTRAPPQASSALCVLRRSESMCVLVRCRANRGAGSSCDSGLTRRPASSPSCPPDTSCPSWSVSVKGTSCGLTWRVFVGAHLPSRWPPASACDLCESLSAPVHPRPPIQAAIEERIAALGAESVACVITTTSCFAPRACDQARWPDKPTAVMATAPLLHWRHEITHPLRARLGASSTPNPTNGCYHQHFASVRICLSSTGGCSGAGLRRGRGASRHQQRLRSSEQGPLRRHRLRLARLSAHFILGGGCRPRTAPAPQHHAALPPPPLCIARRRVGRVDAVVQSADKNFLVPVGGALVAAGKRDPSLVRRGLLRPVPRRQAQPLPLRPERRWGRSTRPTPAARGSPPTSTCWSPSSPWVRAGGGALSKSARSCFGTSGRGSEKSPRLTARSGLLCACPPSPAWEANPIKRPLLPAPLSSALPGMCVLRRRRARVGDSRKPNLPRPHHRHGLRALAAGAGRSRRCPERWLCPFRQKCGFLHERPTSPRMRPSARQNCPMIAGRGGRGGGRRRGCGGREGGCGGFLRVDALPAERVWDPGCGGAKEPRGAEARPAPPHDGTQPE